jgi:hypothetical protein
MPHPKRRKPLKGPPVRPGTISGATAEDAGRFLNSMYEARRKYWASRPKVQQTLFAEPTP